MTPGIPNHVFEASRRIKLSAMVIFFFGKKRGKKGKGGKKGESSIPGDRNIVLSTR